MFIPKGVIDNKSALVQVMAWHRTSNKPLPEPMLTQFTDTLELFFILMTLLYKLNCF